MLLITDTNTQYCQLIICGQALVWGGGTCLFVLFAPNISRYYDRSTPIIPSNTSDPNKTRLNVPSWVDETLLPQQYSIFRAKYTKIIVQCGIHQHPKTECRKEQNYWRLRTFFSWVRYSQHRIYRIIVRP